MTMRPEIEAALARYEEPDFLQALDAIDVTEAEDREITMRLRRDIAGPYMRGELILVDGCFRRNPDFGKHDDAFTQRRELWGLG
jgi:hypothetical protein